MPLQTAVVNQAKKKDDPREGTLSDAWIGWMQDQNDILKSAPIVVGSVSLSGQTASIASTAIQTATLSRGIYRVSYYARVTAGASVSSSLDVSFQWTDEGISCLIQSGYFTAITANFINRIRSYSVLLAVDGGTTVNYSTTYASVGTPMAYKLDVILEQVLI